MDREAADVFPPFVNGGRTAFLSSSKLLVTHLSCHIRAYILSRLGVSALRRHSSRLVGLAALALLSAVTLYLFPFPFSLLCFIIMVMISWSWYLVLAEEWAGTAFEIRSYLLRYLLQYMLPPCLVTALALTYLTGVGSWLQVPLAIVVAFFVPGFVILYLLEDWKDGPSFSLLGMACALSVVFNALVYSFLILTPLSPGWRAGVFLCLYLVLAFVPALKEPIASGLKEGEGHPVRFDELVLLSVYTIVVACTILVLYPTDALVPGLDITVHFNDARVAALFPTYLNSNYPFFNFNQGVAILLSGPPAGRSLFSTYNPIFQATSALVGGLVLMFAFYSLARSQLAGFGSRTALVATGIFMLFGGLAWTQVRNPAFGPRFGAFFLNKLYITSYWDSQGGPGQALWLWFRPITLGVLFLVLLLSLLANHHERPRRTMLITVLLVTGLCFVHIPELLVFVALLLVLAVVKPTSMPGLGQVAAGLALSCPVIALLALEQMRLRILTILGGYEFLGVFLAGSLLAYLVSRFAPRPSLHVGSNPVRIIGLLSLVGYAIFVVIWLRSPLGFTSVQVSALQIVPTGIYPILLGVGGALALLAFVFFDELRSRPLVASICLLVVFFLIGRSLSLLNYFVFFTDYWERRIVPILWIPLSILAAFALVRTCSLLRSRSGSVNRRRSGSMAAVATLGLVVLLGSSTMFVGVWNGRVGESQGRLDPYGLSMASHLASSVTASHTLFPSASETGLARYAPTVYTAGAGSVLNFQEVFPERPLISMVDTGYGAPYVLASSIDMASPWDTALNGYMADLLQILPASYVSGYAKLYSLGSLSAPSPASSTCIGVSDKPSTEEFLAYDMLSSLGANYTSVSNSDASLGECGSVVLGANVGGTLAQRLLSSPGNYSLTVLGEGSRTFFSRMFLNATGTKTLVANRLTGDGGTYGLPSTLSVRQVGVSAGTRVSSYYLSSSGGTVPLSLQRAYGNHSVTFLNVQPFVDALQPLGKTKLAVFSLFRLMAEAAGIRFEPAQSPPSSLGVFTIAFARADLVGNASFETASMVLKAAPISGTVTTTSGSMSVSGATGLSLYSLGERMTASTMQANLTSGEGFYANATFTQPLVVNGADLRGTLSFRNGTTVPLRSVVRVDVSSSGNPSLLLRTPTVRDSQGSVMLGYLVVFNAGGSKKLVATNQATLTGGVSFDIRIGDRVNIATGLRYSAVTYPNPPVNWNESALFYYVAPELCVLAVALAWWYYRRRPEEVGGPEPLS